jgi:hypothetical protein
MHRLRNAVILSYNIRVVQSSLLTPPTWMKAVPFETEIESS